MAIYAIPSRDAVDELGRYFIGGKKYPVLRGEDQHGFYAVDEYGGTLCCLWEDCAHLDGGNWQRVEEPDAPAADFRSMSDHELADWAVANGLAGGCAEEIAGRFATENIKTTTGSRDFRDYFTHKENPNHA